MSFWNELQNDFEEDYLYMNAIILAAGNSLRMYQSGGHIHKALLPIQGIPNIERTILMLRCLHINKIIIAVPYQCKLFDYLEEKYSCVIYHKDQHCLNTLHTLVGLLPYIDDTFIIEGDVVLAKNVFDIFEHSTYYVMKYPNPEIDDWHPILNKYGNISSFEIGPQKTIAIFGISFWTHKDCSLLISHLRRQALLYAPEDPHIFWDDNITELLDKIQIKTYEISNMSACEMNTYKEYQLAEALCNVTANDSSLFFDSIIFHTFKENTYYKIINSVAKDKNICWLNQLLRHYGEIMDTKKNTTYEEFFASDEMCYIVVNSCHEEIAFISLVKQKEYILLRRLYVNSSYRNKYIGTQIIHYVQLYSLFTSTELRINVYDNKAENFYKHLGFNLKFKTYSIKPELYTGDNTACIQMN